MKNTTSIVLMFFSLLFIALFLGDGKQATIDVYGVAVVIVCWVLYLYKQKNEKRKFFPVYLLLPWLAVGIVAVVSTLFSASAGLSISWLVRLVSGYLVYRLFFEISNEENARVFNGSLLFLVMGAAALFFVNHIWGGFRGVLPSMNLLDVRYGHSHLADLLVIAAPIILRIGTEARAPRLVKGGLILLFLFILLTTFARGAWVIVGLFFLYKFIASKRVMTTRALAYVLTVVVFVGIAGFYWRSSIVRPQTIGSRLEYWRQGIEAFKDHPLFGVGPGTFSLISLQYQKSAATFSWFAHSLPIQTLAEQGIFGFIALSWLVITQIHAFRRKKNNQELLWGVVLIGVYSLFEFVLDYLLVWLLFWSSVGLLAGRSTPGEPHKKGRIWQVLFPLIFIAAYYATSILSTAFVLLGKYDLAFYIAPYDGVTIMLYIVHVKKEPNNFDFLIPAIFHKENLTILAEISERYYNFGYKNEARKYIESAMRLYPKVESIHEKYIKNLISEKDYSAVSMWLQEQAPNFYYMNIQHAPDELYVPPGLIAENPTQTFDLFDSRLSHRVRYGKFYYQMGLYSYTHDAQTTRKLWKLAGKLLSDLSYIWIERAALESHIFLNDQGATNIINDCLKNPSARPHCEESLKNGALPLPGYYQRQINE